MSLSTATAREPDLTARPAPPLLERLREGRATAEGRSALIASAACCGLLALIFRANLRHFAYVWSTDANYSHGFLVPLISLYFANAAARRGRSRTARRPGSGRPCWCSRSSGRLATIVVPVGFAADLALLLGLAGVVALLGGRGALRRYGFALAFLVFMVPLPIHLYTTIASPLQLMVSRAAATLLNASGVPVLCEGNLMTLPGGVQMFVAEACSGMRQLTGFLALTAAVAYLAERPAWYRAVLVASSIPIALTANVARVCLTGCIMHYDPSPGGGDVPHPRRAADDGLRPGAPAARMRAAERPDRARPGGSGSDGGTEPMTSSTRRAALALAILGGGLAAEAAVERATRIERPSLVAPLATIPMELGDWVGRDLPVDPEILRESQATEYLNRVYESRGDPADGRLALDQLLETRPNLRHSPDLPALGRLERSRRRTGSSTSRPRAASPQRISRLGYGQGGSTEGELVQKIGFWYYIFGEGRWSTSSAACRSPAGAATGGRPAARA